jgi:hypothetical protein
MPISRAHPGGPKWALIQQCHQLYQKALTRFAVLPLDLRLPEGFCYYEGGQMTNKDREDRSIIRMGRQGLQAWTKDVLTAPKSCVSTH